MKNVKCKIKRSNVALLVLTMGWFFAVAQEVTAAVYVLAGPEYPARVGQEVEALVKVDTEGERVNVFNVAIVIPTELEFSGVNKEHSAVNIWVQEPAFEESSRTLTFIGGVPGGAMGVLELLGVRLQPKQTGAFALRVSPKSEAYLNDGFGTPALVQTPEAVIVVEKARSVSRLVWLISASTIGLIVGFLIWWLWHSRKIYRQAAS